MDYKKIILYLALAFVSVSIWNAWQREFPAQTVKQQETAAAVVKPSTDVPLVPEHVNVNNTPKSTDTSAAFPSKAVSSNKSNVITVKTDVLTAHIDLNGGNITSLALPAYPKSLKTPNSPVELLRDTQGKQYIAQSGLTGKLGPDTEKGFASYTSKQRQYSLAPGQKQLTVDLTYRNNKGLKVTKRFVFERDKYDVSVSYLIKNNGASAWSGRLFTQLKHQGQPPKRSLFHFSTYEGASYSSPEKPYKKLSYGDMKDENLSKSIQGGWLALQQHYFLSAWVPNQRLTHHYYSRYQADGDTYIIGALGPALTVEPGKSGSISATFYGGPEDTARLKAIAPHLNLTVDYGWLWFISNIIFWLMKEIHLFLGNWGWSIVLVTMFIKALFYKLSAKSYRSMANMRKLTPKLQALKERLGDDKAKLSKATMELYRKEKVNPLGGCLPILVQIPVFIALYYVLIESVQLRQAPFILWIHDLSIKDPYYILPLLMGLSMFVQQKLNPPPPDPMQAKMMLFLPVVFTCLFLNFPAGLVLYWVVNNSLSITQQWWITRSVEKAAQKKKRYIEDDADAKDTANNKSS